MSATIRAGLAGIALVDTAVTPRVRVRAWHHRFGPTDFPPATHGFVEVAWLLGGAVTYRIGTRSLSLSPGQGIVVPARTEHATAISAGARAGSAWIASEVVSQVAASLGRKPLAAVTLLEETEHVARIGALLQTEAEAARPGQLLAVDALAEALVVAIVRAVPEAERAASDPRIANAVALIESRYSEPLSVDDLSRAAGISRFHFSRMFRDALGVSPYQYLQRVRVERADELLARGHGVTQAALSVGFRDLGRFARAFRDQTGRGPSERSRARIAARSARSA